MPFTLSHPIAALPFKKLKRAWFSTTGLVMGSMSPDFEYFMKQYPSPTISEIGWGIFLFDLPLAIIGCLLFQLLIKAPLLRSLPAPYDLRFSSYAQRPFLSYLGKHPFGFLFSVLIGMGTHILLDWLTNPTYGPLAKTSFTDKISLGPVQVTPLLFSDHFFSVVSIILLTIFLLRLKAPSNTFHPISPGIKLIFWTILLITAAALLIWEWIESGGFEGFTKGVPSVIWAGFAGLVTASAIISWLYPVFRKN